MSAYHSIFPLLFSILATATQAQTGKTISGRFVDMANYYKPPTNDDSAAQAQAMQEQAAKDAAFAKERSNAATFYYQCAGQSGITNPPAPDNADENNIDRNLLYCLTQYRTMMQDIANRQSQWQQGFNKKYAALFSKPQPVVNKAANITSKEKHIASAAGNAGAIQSNDKILTFYIFLFASVSMPRGTGLEALRDPPTEIVISAPVRHTGKISDDLTALKAAFADKVVNRYKDLGEEFTSSLHEVLTEDNYKNVTIQYTAPYISRPLLTEAAATNAIKAFKQDMQQMVGVVGTLHFIQMEQ